MTIPHNLPIQAHTEPDEPLPSNSHAAAEHIQALLRESRAAAEQIQNLLSDPRAVVEQIQNLLSDPRTAEQIQNLLSAPPAAAEHIQAPQDTQNDQQEEIAPVAWMLAAKTERLHALIAESIRALPPLTLPQVPNVALPRFPAVKVRPISPVELPESLSSTLHPIAEALHQLLAKAGQIIAVASQPIAINVKGQIAANLIKLIDLIDDAQGNVTPFLLKLINTALRQIAKILCHLIIAEALRQLIKLIKDAPN